MKTIIVILLLLSFRFSHAQTDESFIREIYDEALENGESYENLRVLCKDIGARITGSAEATMAVRWGERLLKSYGFDTVFLQQVMVPHWERGTREAGWIIAEDGETAKLDILALGGSIGTEGLLEGEVLKVRNVDALKKLTPDQVEGRIIFLSEAFDQKLISTFSAYSSCYPLRGNGTSEAGRLGAKAVVIRSLATPQDHYPHTGTSNYAKGVRKIPGAAISTESAELLSKWLEKGPVKLMMEMDCKTYPDKLSYNVIAEINGKDDKIITIGGHLDSWDVGEGAHDDGAGIVHSIEALRILKKLGYQPNHTIRCVLFMNEENGNRGGEEYARVCSERGEKHICAIESDSGGFLPLGFNINGSDEQVKNVRKNRELMTKFELDRFNSGFGGVDIGPLLKYYPNMVQMGLRVNSQEYFNYHHSAADVLENVNKRELELGAAAMAAMVYLMDQQL